MVNKIIKELACRGHPTRILFKTHLNIALFKTYFSIYCAFHKQANSKVQKPPSQLRFSLAAIIITITSNEPGKTETLKTDRNPTITNHKP